MKDSDPPISVGNRLEKGKIMPQPHVQKLQSGHGDAARKSLDVLGRELLNPVSNAALFWKPRHPEPSSALAHLPFLFWLIENHAPRRVVQLGVGDGTAYLAICQALDKLHVDTACWGITFPDNEKQASKAAIEANKLLYQEFSTLKTEGMATAHRHFRNTEIDLLIINTYLDEENAQLLTSKWIDVLSDRGIIVILDSAIRMKDSTAGEWLDSLLAAHRGIEFDQADGLIALTVGGDQVKPISRLANLELGVAGYRETQQIFRRLGECVSAETKAKELEASIAAERLASTQAREDIEKKSVEVTKARKSEEGALSQVATLQAKAFDLEADRDRLLSEIAAAKDAAKEAEAERLAKIDEAERAMTAMNQRLDDVNNQLLQSQGAHNETKEKLDRAERNLAELERVRADLQSAMDTALVEMESRLNVAVQAHDNTIEKLSVVEANLLKSEAMREDLESVNKGEQPGDFVTLQRRYQERLADIAELGHILSEKDDALKLAKSQRDAAVQQRFILDKLNASRAQLHKALNQPFRVQKHMRTRAKIAEDTRLLKESGLFDAEWYCASYSELDGQTDPLKYFVKHGAYDLHNPGPNFDSLKYHIAYPDVTAEGIPAIIHYLRNGMGEKRNKFSVGQDS